MIELNEPRALLDIKGLVMHSAHRGDDPNGAKNEDGKVEPTAEYAFESFLETYMVPILADFAPRNIIAVWDGGSSYRKGIYPTYKKKRGERTSSDFLHAQMDTLTQVVKEFLGALGCLQCVVPEVEADDMIALLVDKLPGNKLVYTVDVDIGVLSSPTCTVFLKNDPMIDHHVYKSGSGANKRETPVPLRLISLFKSMVGDSSDEYPGVKGFGPAKWEDLAEYVGDDGLEELEACVASGNFAMLSDALEEEHTPELGMLYENRNDWALQYNLARLHPEICEGVRNNKLVKIKWAKYAPERDTVARLLTWSNTSDMRHHFDPYMLTTTLVTRNNFDEAAGHFVKHVKDAPVCSFDYESYDVLENKLFQEAKTTGIHVDVLSQSVTGCSFSYGSNLQHTIYLSVDHKDTDNLEDTVIKDFIDEALEQGVHLIAHNAPFEIALTDTNFETLLETVIDTRIMSVYMDENEEHGLKKLSAKHLRYNQTSYKDVLEQAKVDNMQQLTGPQVLNYGCDDSIVTSCLFDLMFVILQLEGTWDFIQHEFDTASTLYEGFESGLNIDWDRMEELKQEDQTTITEGEAALRAGLAEHCTQENKLGAETLYEDLEGYSKAKMELDGKDPAAIESRLSALSERILAGSKYVPFVTVKKEVNFKPTKAQINKVIEQLAFDTRLEGAAKSKINEWAVPAALEIGTTPDQADFIAALVDAAPQISKREGKFYDVFHKMCTRILSGEAGSETFGDELNFDSPTQMQMLLYAKLGLPIRIRSKVQPNSGRDQLGMTGAPATSDRAVDAALAEDVSLESWRGKVLTSMRDVKHAMTCFKYYYVPYPKWKHPRDGMVHASTLNCGTVTHRFTGSDPNPYQLSKKRGGRIRTFILPKKKGHVILSPDLNGEELRITASMSRDPVMMDAYLGANKKDIHSLTAAAITPIMLPRLDPQYAETTDVSYDEFVEALEAVNDLELSAHLKEIRGLAKAVNFLILYVGGAPTLSINLGVPQEVAQAFIDAVLLRYPRLRSWQDESIAFAKDHGYVLTSYGNRRHLSDDLFSRDNYLRTKAERQAVNSQVQGTGADIMKVILSGMHNERVLQDCGGSLIVPPYDEVAVSVPRETAWDCWLQMKEIMAVTPPGNAVPQLPELKASALNWGTCIEMGADPDEALFNEIMDRQLAERRAA